MPIAFQEWTMLLIRFLITILSVVYVIFAILMSRQIGLMTKAVTMKDSGIILTSGYVHLVFAIIVLFLALTML